MVESEMSMLKYQQRYIDRILSHPCKFSPPKTFGTLLQEKKKNGKKKQWNVITLKKGAKT